MIKIDVVGKIVEGVDTGRLIKIQEVNGSYLILFLPDESHKSGSDVWIENFKVLEEAFAESKWKIEWES